MFSYVPFSIPILLFEIENFYYHLVCLVLFPHCGQNAIIIIYKL